MSLISGPPPDAHSLYQPRAKTHVAGDVRPSAIDDSMKDEDYSGSPETPAVPEERRLLRQVDVRVVPVAMLGYIAYFFDRSNVGNARILNADRGHSLVQSLNLSNSRYLDVLVIYLVAYSLFQLPSNHILKRAYPSRWLPFIMCCWGVTTVLQSQVSSFSGLSGLRFVTGAFEAGYFPGIILLTTFWYKRDERAFRLALITASASLGGAFGGSLAYAVGLMDGVRGLEAWRWLSIFEGSVTVIIAITVHLVLPDFPETATWLSPSERNLAIARLSGKSALGLQPISWRETREALLDWRLYLHYSVFIFTGVPFSSFSLFTPTIVSGLGFTGLDAQLMTVPPFAASFVVVLGLCWLADKTKTWSLLIIACSCIAAIAFIIQGVLPEKAFGSRYGLLCIALSFTYTTLPLILAYLTMNIRGTSAITVGIAMNNSLSFVGQLAGLYIYKESDAPRYRTGHFTNAAVMLACAANVLALRILYRWRNSRLSAGVEAWTV